MSTASILLLALAWLLTYIVHSTVFLGGTLALCAGARRLPVRWQDRLWKLALVGGLVTATVQVGAGLEPFGGRVLLRSDGTAASAADVDGRGAAAPGSEPSVAFPVDGGGIGREVMAEVSRLRAVHDVAAGATPALERDLRAEAPPARELAATAPSAAPAQEAAALPPLPTGRAWIPWVCAAWAAAAGLGIAAFIRAQLRLRRHLRGRVELEGGPLRARLDALMARAGVRGGVRLTVSPFVCAPLTHGLVRREICVPLRVLSDLSPAQQEALLGHELGHALRRDPAWLGLCWLLERALLVQPLNRVARARLQHAAELLCDDWAVHLTGRRLSLASCLTEVAQWVVGPAPALPAPGMALPGAPLTRRVERLLAAPPREVTHRERWWLAGGLAALGVVTLGAPGFALALREAEPCEDAAPLPDPEPEPLPASDPEPSPDPAPPDPAPAAASGPLSELGALCSALDVELQLAEQELRALKREAYELGAVDRVADQLLRLEQGVRALRARHATLRTLLPRVLGTPEPAAPAPPLQDEP